MPAEYRVALDLYSGPLDLLLYLVRRNEIDVRELAIARITAQFVEFLDVIEFLDLDLVGEFLVLAGTLLEIKSRLALPQVEEEEPESEVVADSSDDLIRRLLEYRKFKDAVLALEERAAAWHERFPRLSDDRPAQEKDSSADRIKEVELWDLVSALSRVLQTKTVEREERIRHDETPIGVYVERIGAKVRQAGRVPFSEFFEGTNRRSRIVAIFLAVLELLRHHAFRAEQPIDGGEIWVLPPLPGRDRGPISDRPTEFDEPASQAASDEASSSSSS